jgi:hypothetical protein
VSVSYPLLTYKKSAHPNQILRNICAATPCGKAAKPPLRLHDEDDDDDDDYDDDDKDDDDEDDADEDDDDDDEYDDDEDDDDDDD